MEQNADGPQQRAGGNNSGQATGAAAAKTPPSDPFPNKSPAPEFGQAEWLNTSGPITLRSLRGKIVLLDFWTYCCINCMHVLPELKRLEEKYADELVVIGVHSAKFDGERDSQNIREAILRYEIAHPVINDAGMVLWRKYGVRAWPTLWLIDPEGNAVGYLSGEGVYEALDRAIGLLVAYHRARGTLRPGPVYFHGEAERAEATPLRFPGKVLADADTDRLFIADSNHNRIVIATLTGKLVATAGTGRAGRQDGRFDQASFFRPQGMALAGQRLYVADTENHLIRCLDLRRQTVTTVAGTGRQGRSRSFLPSPALQTPLSSPWDLFMHDGRLYVAMAGVHQLWVYDPQRRTVRAWAGSGREDIVDGPLQQSALAQPSGLAGDRTRLFVADSEGSSIRAVSLRPGGQVQTVIGTARLPHSRLFTFGDRDGTAAVALLQHPLGVAHYDGRLFVADTYNNKIKVIDLATKSCHTLLGTGQAGRSDQPAQFDEPGGLTVAAGKLYIADTNNHLIRVADLDGGQVTTLTIAGLGPPRPQQPAEARTRFPNARRLSAPVHTAGPNRQLRLHITVNLAPGYKLNELAPMSYLVESLDGKGLVTGEVMGRLRRLGKPARKLDVILRTGERTGTERLRVGLTYYPCRDDASGLCEIKSVVWELPLRVQTGAGDGNVSLEVSDELAKKPDALPLKDGL